MIMEFTKEKSKIAYYNEEGKILAEVTFPAVNKNTVNINHTFVDESLRGQGIAGKLMQAAAQYLDESGKKSASNMFLCCGLVCKTSGI